MSKRITNLIREVIEGEVIVAEHWLDKKTYGMYVETEKGKRLILLNSHLFFSSTFLHEFLHFKHPNWSEKKVYKETDKLINKLSVKELKELAKKVKKLF